MAQSKKPKKPKKHLTREDVEIWDRITRTAKPLPDDFKNFDTLLSDDLLPPAPIPALVKKLRLGVATTYTPAPAPKPEFAINNLDPGTTKKISKGKISIDGRLDLHGLSQQQAFQQLLDYVEDSFYSGRKIILVITGRGNMGRGILRENVPKWLAGAPFTRLVSAFNVSGPGHGGAGALYVRIRRKEAAK